MIRRCALGVITERGKNVVRPTLNSLTRDENDFLQRHVDELRALNREGDDVRTRLRGMSTFKEDLEELLTCDESAYVEISVRLVDALAASMRSTTRAESCVVAVVTSGSEAVPDTSSFLKLDAQIEAARLRQTQGGVRLQVFRELLPAPGEMQKGLSWPDPRPGSEIILRDRNRGNAAQYFQSAFGIDASPKPLMTEEEFVDQLITELGPERAARAVATVQDKGGLVEEVAAQVRAMFPDFSGTDSQTAQGKMPGKIRAGQLAARKRTYRSDGIKLEIPVDKLDRLTVRAEGSLWVTTVTTTRPLGPVTTAGIVSDPISHADI